jgi:hypothetical protein
MEFPVTLDTGALPLIGAPVHKLWMTGGHNILWLTPKLSLDYSDLSVNSMSSEVISISN